MAGPFDDLIPDSNQQSGGGSPSDPYADLIPKKRPSIGQTVAGLGRQLAGGAVAGTGAAITGIGELTGGTAAKQAGRDVADYGAEIQQGASAEFRQVVEDTTPSGELLSPSTWSLGEDPSVVGALGQIAGGLGTSAPTMATALLTRGRAAVPATMAVGGLSEGGGASQQESQRIADMGQAQLDAVPRYRELLASGMDPAQARAALAAEAGSSAFAPAGAIGALGGVLEAAPFFAPVRRAFGELGSGAATRAAIAGTGGAALEGAQEAAVGAASVAGANAATGEDRSLLEDSFSNAVLGAAIGGPLNAIGAAVSPPGQPSDAGGADTIGADFTPEERAAFEQARAADLAESSDGVADVAPEAAAAPFPDPQGPMARAVNAGAAAGALGEAPAAGAGIAEAVARQPGTGMVPATTGREMVPAPRQPAGQPV
ncbi:MAG: hypothetical protein ACRC2H_09205, partial [Silanimonas sp.]